MNPLRPITPRILLLELAGNAVLALCAALWLEIPDSHAWQLILSVVLALAIAATFLWLHTAILHLLRQPLVPTRIWLGAILLGIWLLLLQLPLAAAAHLDYDAMRRAGYWNSQLDPHLRATLTFERLLAWQNDATQVFLWAILPALLLPFLIETVTTGIARPAWRAALRTLLRWQHWLSVIAISWSGNWIVTRLIDWHPSVSVRGELLSAALRLSLAYLIVVLLFTAVLAVVAHLLARNDTARNAAA